MNPSRPFLIRLLLIGLLLLGVPGCNYFLLLGYLIGGPPQIEPLFEKETKKSMTDKDVRVAVICTATDDLKYEFENLDHIIASQVTKQLAGKKVEVVSYDQVRVWDHDAHRWAYRSSRC